MPKRVSILSNKAAVEYACSHANSVSSALNLLHLRPAGGNFKAIKLACERFKIDLPIFHNDNTHRHPRIPDEQIFRERSKYTNRAQMKKRLLEHGAKGLCALCGNDGVWCGKTLTLQLDHINGVSDDNRVENLRLLCPNCHSQTKTFCGKNTPNRCLICSKAISNKSKRCRHCSSSTPRPNKEKITWPSTVDLVSRINNSSYVAVARELGVSDKAVKKRVLRHMPLEHSVVKTQQEPPGGVAPPTSSLPRMRSTS